MLAIILIPILIIVFVGYNTKKATDNRKKLVDQVFWGNSNSTDNTSASSEVPKDETTPRQTYSDFSNSDIGTTETETTDGEKTAEQMYLEWEVYNLLTDSIKDSRLMVNPLQIWCSERSDDGHYMVYGIYYIGDDLHSITVHYDSEGDGSTFDTEDFHISEVIVDQEKVYPDENG